MDKEQKIKSPLKDYKVIVRPIRRKGGWVTPDKANSFLFGNATKEYVAVLGLGGYIESPLTDEETAYFEHKFNKSLNPMEDDHKKNFWIQTRVALTGEPLILDLSKDSDYISWKILLANENQIAPTAEDALKKGTYKYAIERIGYQEAKASKIAKTRTDAYKVIAELDNKGIEALTDFLNVVMDREKNSKKWSTNNSHDSVMAEFDKLAMTKPQVILDVNSDVNLDYKILLKKAINARAITRSDSGVYQDRTGKLIGSNTDKAIAWLQEDENSESILLIKSIIEEHKGKALS